MANYTKASPYAFTPMNKAGYLDILNIRSITAEDDDILYQIETQYTYRPDLLAYDLYGSSKLWWVFANRNIDVIKDPIFDFIPGRSIYLPKQSNIREDLGI